MGLAVPPWGPFCPVPSDVRIPCDAFDSTWPLPTFCPSASYSATAASAWHTYINATASGQAGHGFGSVLTVLDSSILPLGKSWTWLICNSPKILWSPNRLKEVPLLMYKWFFFSIYLQSQVNLLQWPLHLSGECVHPLTLLQSYQHIWRLLLCLGKQL